MHFAFCIFLLAGCSQPGDESKDLPDHSKKVVVALSKPAESWNPLILDSEDSWEPASACFAAMTRWNDHWELEPVLLKHLPTVKNGELKRLRAGRLSANFTFKPDLHWPDGTPLTSHHFMFTYQVANHPLLAKEVHFPERIDRLSATQSDRLSVLWRGVEPRALSPFLIPLPQHVMEKALHEDPTRFREGPLWRRPVGNGPFVDTSKGGRAPARETIWLTRNPHFPARAKAIQQMGFKLFPDRGKFLEALQKGAADISDGTLTTQEAEVLVKKNPDLRQHVSVPSHLVCLAVDLRDRVLGDPNCRKAILRILDRRFLVSQRPRTRQMARSCLPEAHPDFVSVLPDEPQDLAAARDLLVQYGMELRNETLFTPTGEKLIIPLNFQAEGGDGPLVDTLISWFRKVGIEIVPQQKTGTEFLTAMKERARFQLWLLHIPMTPLTQPADYWASTRIHKLRGGTGLFFLPWFDRKYEAACKSVMAAPTEEVFRKGIEEEQRIWAKALPALPLYFESEICVAHRKLLGPSPRGFSGITWNCEEWLWAK